MKLAFAAVALTLAAPSLAHPPRPAADIARDAARKPTEMLALAKIGKGSRVADLLPGGGYFTRLISAAVEPGSVVAIVPPQSAELYPADAKAIADLAADKEVGNVTVVQSAAQIPPASLDVFWTAQNYHDIHAFQPPENVVAFNRQVFAALKSGGYYVIVDHTAAPGAGVSVAKSLHRIEPLAVKTELTAIGFVFDGETAILANPADPRTASVFDPAIRGKTDQFAYRFRKP